MISWTLIKITPYFLTIVGGLFLSFLFSKIRGRIRFFRFFVWVFPFVIYFILNPIYEGDFSNNYREITLKNGLVSSKEAQLIVITIPGCPFCKASIETMKQLKKRVPSLKVKYIVCSTDSSSTILYKREINGVFPVSTSIKSKEWAKICQGKFPSYVLISKESTRIWSNDNFGTLAKDEVEDSF
jgi:hypothetical protein